MVGKAGLVHSVLQGPLHATSLVDLERHRSLHFHRSDRKLGGSSEVSSPDIPCRPTKQGMLKKKQCTRGDDSRSYVVKFSRRSMNSKRFHRTRRDSETIWATRESYPSRLVPSLQIINELLTALLGTKSRVQNETTTYRILAR